MSGVDDSIAFARTQQAWEVTGAPVAAARRRVLEGLFGPSEDTKAGRFELRTVLGRGSFGTVWRAFDPMLDREVAVKLVDHHRIDDRATERFLREARAVAGLSHPNVVEVFDVGVLEGAPYLAMELVESGSLDDWLKEPRPVPRVLEVFLDAARGLAAAHASGLVHRDFKPANVLLGDDGRPRVADFGLAVLAEEREATTAPTGPTSTSTASTPFAGTPAFMAPEQHLGGRVDRRADVHAWCASLHLAIHGGLPFVSDTLEGLVRGKLSHRIRYEPRGPTAAPAWLRAVIRRGLAPDPAHRFGSMEEVIEAIERGPAVRRRRGLAGVLMGAGLLAGAGLGSRGEPVDCRAIATERLASTWSSDRAARLRDSLGSRPELADVVTGRLDTLGAAWIDARAAACERGADPRDSAVVCLERMRAELTATIDELDGAEPSLLDRARQLVRELGDPSRCARARLEPTITDPELAAEVDAIHAELATLRVARRAGTLASRVERAAEVARRASATAVPSVEAEAALVHGRAEQAAGSFETAVEHCERAHFIASEHDLGELALESALCVARIRGVRLGQREPALGWARRAEAALDRVEDSGPRAARLEDIVANIHWASADAQTALVHHDRAIELYRAASPPFPRLLAVALSNRANVLADLGRLDEAIASQRGAVETLGQELGPRHQLTAATRCALGSLLTDTDPASAVRQLDVGIADLERDLPPGHVWVVQARANRGLARRLVGDSAGAEADMAAALRDAEAVAGLGGIEIRVGLGSNLGDLLLSRGQADRARERFETARALAYDELGRGDARSLLLAVNVARIDAESPETIEAAEERLRETIDLALEHDQPDLAALARFELAKLQPSDARALAEAALAHWRTRPPGRSEVAPFPDSASERAAELERWLAG